MQTRVLVQTCLFGPALWGSLVLACAEAARPDVPPPPPPPIPLTVPERLDAIRAALPSGPEDGLTHVVSIEGAADNFVALRAALDRVVSVDGEEPSGHLPQARIAMFGSSHVAGDLVSGFLRERLQERFGDAGHGFAIAVPPYDTYWQWGVEVSEGEGWGVSEANGKALASGAFGPIGIAFDAIEPAFAELRVPSAERLEILYLEQPNGGALSVSVDGVTHSLPTEAASPRAGVEYVGVAPGPHVVRLEADGGRPVRIYGVGFENERAGVVVDQLGLNASTAAHILQNDELIQRAFLSQRRPDLFVIWLGANEASEDWPIEVQAERFGLAIERLRAAMPGSGCLVLGTLDRRQHDPTGAPFVPWALPGMHAMQREVALAHGCAFYESMAWQGGEGAVERFLAASPPLSRTDRVHLTHEGYLRYAADLTRALLEVLEPRMEGP